MAAKRASFPEEFLEFVEGHKFRHPDTGNEVVFQSLPSEEQTRRYTRWKTEKDDAPEGAKTRKNKDGILFVDDSPYAELMSKYLSSPSKKYPRETQHWNSVRDWAVREKPSHHDLESVLMAFDSGHVSPPEDVDDVHDLARRLGIGAKKKAAQLKMRIAAARQRVLTAWAQMPPARRVLLRRAFAELEP
jgi:hypothetical protein